MEQMLVLVADGDKRIRNLINVTLKAHDYKCITANGGEDAILLASSNSPDMVMLDLALPDMDGTEVIRKIRSWSDIPIIVISARKEDHDKIMALDAGADDYLTKPFSVEELLARLRVMKRRYFHSAAATAPTFENGDLKIDYASNCVYMKHQEVHLTPIEYRLLCILAQNIDRVLTHTFITKEIWGSSWNNNIMTLRTFMASLRKKINISGDSAEYIHTHTGVGYRMLRVDSEE